MSGTKSQASKNSRVSRAPKKVRRGIRAAMQVNTVSAFLDVHEASTPIEKCDSYTSKLQEGMNIDVIQFLYQINRKRARERLRMAICGELEKRLRRGRGKLQINRVQRLADVRDPEKYKEKLSSKLLKHAESARAAGDKEKLARVQKYEDHAYRQRYVELAVAERSVSRLTEAEKRAAAERMRRLRERVYSHRYLLLPCGFSVHGIIKAPPPPERAQGEDSNAEHYCRSTRSSSWKAQTFWPPQTDIDIHVPCIPISVDLSQARTVTGLVDYFKRWKYEDARMMWYPPPHHTGYYAAFARWGYALRMVLHGVDEKYPWRSLSWVEMRRRSRMKFEYVDALCAPLPIDEGLVAVLQVGMPLSEIISGRYAAAKLRLAEKEKNMKAKKGKSESDNSLGTGSTTPSQTISLQISPSFSDDDLDKKARQAKTAEVRAAVKDANLMADIEANVAEELPIAAKSFQVQAYLGQCQAQLCGPAPLMDGKPRKVIVKMEASGVQLVASHSAPRAIWTKLAPPSAVVMAAQNEDTPEGVAAEVGLEDLKVVFCGMPTAAPQMRRLLGIPKPVILRDGQTMAHTPTGPMSEAQRESFRTSTAGRISTMTLATAEFTERGALCYHKAPQSLSETERQTATFAMQARLAYVGKEQAQDTEDGQAAKEIPRWEFAVWTSPMDVHLCHPLMKKLLANFRPPPLVPRWYHNSPESKLFWEELQMYREKHVAANVKRRKMARKAELLTGVAGPLVGSRVCGEVLLRGGMRGSRLDVYSQVFQGSWLCRSCALPSGIIKIDRVVDGGPQLMVSFLPSDSSSRNVQFQSADGWWFAEEAKAFAATTLFTTGMPDASSIPKGNDGWAGSVAHENPVQMQTPIFDLPRGVLSTWGLDPHDGSLRPRYKPPVSAKGLLPLPPDKRRSGTAFGIALDCCRSLERNVPDTMKPVIGLAAATMPKDGVCCKTELGRPPLSPLLPSTEAQSRPLIAQDYPAPSFTPPGLSRTPTSNSGGLLVTPKSAREAAAERKILAAEPWTLSDMDVTLEILQAKTIGLPEPSADSLKKWWRTMGILPD